MHVDLFVSALLPPPPGVVWALNPLIRFPRRAFGVIRILLFLFLLLFLYVHGISRPVPLSQLFQRIHSVFMLDMGSIINCLQKTDFEIQN